MRLPALAIWLLRAAVILLAGYVILTNLPVLLDPHQASPEGAGATLLAQLPMAGMLLSLGALVVLEQQRRRHRAAA